MRRRRYRRILILLLLVGTILTGIYSYRVLDEMIPDRINVLSKDDINFDFAPPISYKIKEQSRPASLNKADKLTHTEINERYYIETKLFGFLHLKNVEVNIINETKLVPCGFQVGIYLKTEGVMIIGTGSITGLDGMKYEPAKNIVKPNDYIVSLNGNAVNTKSQLIFLINKYGNDDIILGIRRENSIIQVKINPINTDKDEYKLGIWVRDDTQGIGTLTYLTQEGKFGALGHGISDIDTGSLLSSKDGILYQADMWGIRKGESGSPGGLLGSIVYEDKYELGEITGNTNHGIFGQANDKLINACNEEPIPIGLKQDVKKGKAYIKCMLNGSYQDYEIEILKVDYANNKKNKGMVIQVTDTKLLSMTNGIVQGMSGSPIIQDGKIIGAVTHVFVQESTKGYGIFIENMLEK